MLDSDGKIKNPWRRSHISRKELLHRARNHYDVIGFALDAHIALVFSANVLFSVCIVSKHRKPSFVSRRLDQNFLQLNACGCATVLSCFECCLRNENETKLFFRRLFRRSVDQACSFTVHSFYILFVITTLICFSIYSKSTSSGAHSWLKNLTLTLHTPLCVYRGNPLSLRFRLELAHQLSQRAQHDRLSLSDLLELRSYIVIQTIHFAI